MASGRIGIMDGHNIVFRIGALEHLQTSSRGREARALLEERLQEFALRKKERVLVGFDGNDQPSNPDAIKTPIFETVYARRAGGVVADHRIIQEAGRASKRGLIVAVVTDDVSTLATLLPREVHRLGVREFWRRRIEPPPDPDDKPVSGACSSGTRSPASGSIGRRDGTGSCIRANRRDRSLSAARSTSSPPS